MSSRIVEKVMRAIIWSIAIIVIGILITIVGFILIKGLPFVNLEFLTSLPHDMGRAGGILSPIVGTFSITILAVLIAIPFGIGTAFYLAEYANNNIITRLIRFGVESLAGVPSIVYGLFGFIFFVMRLGLGFSIISGALTLAIIILPVIIRTTEEAISSVPDIYREVSFSLGATKWQTIRRVTVPAAKHGMINGIILAVGHCVAETAAVMLTAGSILRMPSSIFSSSRTMSVHFFMLVTEDISTDKAYATGAILIILVFLIDVVANLVIERFFKKGKFDG